MTKDEARLAHALVSLYAVLYKETHGKPIVINKYREKWAMQDVIESVGYDRAKVLLEYYFKTNNSNHALSWFFFNFEKLDLALRLKQKDRAHREVVRENTRLMVEERENE